MKRKYHAIWAGAATWLLLVVLALPGIYRADLIELVLLFAVLVIVPLILKLLQTDFQKTCGLSSSGLFIFHALAAACACISFGIEPGAVAGLLSGPWLLFTLFLAATGLRLLLRSRPPVISELPVPLALLYSAIGGSWLVIARIGLAPMDFEPVIVKLTAVHFHYAGLATPIIATRSLSYFRQSKRLPALVCLGVIAGPPLLAIGITVSPAVELFGAFVQALSLGIWAFLVLRSLSNFRSKTIQILLSIAAFAVAFAMICSGWYACGEFFAISLINIPMMARLHGISNAFGFILSGLVALNILRVHPESQ